MCNGIEYRKNLFIDTIHKFCINNILIPFSSSYSECDISKCKIIKNTTKYDAYGRKTGSYKKDSSCRVTEYDKYERKVGSYR